MLPGVGTGDPRVGADLRSVPWSAVGRLQLPGLSRCTAVMIAPHWAVTAAHCLGAKRLGHVAPPSAVHLLMGYADGAFVRHIVADRVYVDRDAANDPSVHRGRDFALLHFAEAATDFLVLDAGALVPGAALQLGGYGQDRAERLAVDPACTLRGYQADGDGNPLLIHDCNGTRGTSGGAVIRHVDGVWHLVGVAVAGNVQGAGGVAVPAMTVARALAALR